MPSQVRRPVGRATALTSLAVAVAVVAASLVSSVVLHAAQRAAGLAPSGVVVRAWLTYPLESDRGVAAGQPLYFSFVARSSAPVRWEERQGSTVLASGSVPGVAGAPQQVLVQTTAATPGRWLRIEVGDLATPLQVWVT